MSGLADTDLLGSPRGLAQAREIASKGKFALPSLLAIASLTCASLQDEVEEEEVEEEEGGSRNATSSSTKSSPFLSSRGAGGGDTRRTTAM